MCSEMARRSSFTLAGDEKEMENHLVLVTVEEVLLDFNLYSNCHFIFNDVPKINSHICFRMAIVIDYV